MSKFKYLKNNTLLLNENQNTKYSNLTYRLLHSVLGARPERSPTFPDHTRFTQVLQYFNITNAKYKDKSNTCLV